MNYIFDTSAVIVLIEICRLKEALLKFSQENKLYVPLKVKEEFLYGSDPSESIDFDDIFSVINVELDTRLLPYFNFDSSDGAIWVMSYACKNLDCFCVIDEEYGRNICRFFNLKLRGSIRIIIELRKAGLLSGKDLLDIKDRIRKSKFYYTEKLLNELDSFIDTS